MIRNTRARRGAQLAALLMSAIALVGCQSTPVVNELPPPLIADFTIKSRDIDMPVTWVIPQPDVVRGAPMPLAILIHGHGGTRNEAGSFERLASRLADIGIASIRMDFPGSGESSESFAKNNLRNMIEDVRAAESFAFAHANIDRNRIGLVGFSMGGRVAALVSQADGNIDSMVLWAPSVANGAGSMVKMLGGEKAYSSARAMAFEVGSVPFTTSWGQDQQLGRAWFEDIEASRPMDAIAEYGGALFIVHGGADAVVPVEVSRNAIQAAKNARTVELQVIGDADHGFGLFSDNPGQSQELIDSTVRFLRREL